MGNSTTKPKMRRFSARAALAAVGNKLHQLNLFKPVCEHVKIEQKKVKYEPHQKLYDAFMGILAGAHGLVEVNKLVRSDPGLQITFGREACAEQSVIQATLDACTATNVEQMHRAMDEIYRQYSAGYRHDYTRNYQLLDLDMTGLVCGRKAAFATKGYFAKQRNRCGRQMGRVMATEYDEIVGDRLFDGKTQLTAAFQPLVQAAEQTLGLDETKRDRTILRVDSGGGSVEDIKWALARGYHFHGKDYSGRRAQVLAATVTEWIDDPHNPGRQVGWVEEKTEVYGQPVRRIAVRCRKKNGQWGIGVLVSTLSPEDVIPLTEQPIDRVQNPVAVLLAYVYFYDQRGGGVETSFKQDRQGLGINKRNKKRFAAQQMLVQLNALAHNVIVWVRRWLAPHLAKLKSFGIKRMVRDVFQTAGYLVFDAAGQLAQCVLNRDDSIATALAAALHLWLLSAHVAVISGET